MSFEDFWNKLNEEICETNITLFDICEDGNLVTIAINFPGQSDNKLSTHLEFFVVGSNKREAIINEFKKVMKAFQMTT